MGMLMPLMIMAMAMAILVPFCKGERKTASEALASYSSL
jgi:hypothetical protein